MDVYEVLFVLGFLTALGLLLYKFYNVMTLGSRYEFPGIVLTFIGYFLAWLVCFVVWMQYPDTLIYANLMFLLNWLIIVNLLLSVVEGLLLASIKATDSTIRAFKSREGGSRPYSPAGKM
jgi:hypothetical protein